MLPLRAVVAFPRAPLSLVVGRPRSLAAVAAADGSESREILLVAQRAVEIVDPEEDDLFGFGTIARLDEVANLPDHCVKVQLEGQRRARVVRFVPNQRYFEGELEPCRASPVRAEEVQALLRTVKATFERYVRANPFVPPELVATVDRLEDPDQVADLLLAPLQLTFDERQALLETIDVAARLERAHQAMVSEIEAWTPGGRPTDR